jgi:hypothetical protein
VQELFREAIHLWKRFTSSDELTLRGYLRRVMEIDNRYREVLQQELPRLGEIERASKPRRLPVVFADYDSGRRGEENRAVPQWP